VSVMTIPALAISSTDIRARIADGRPIRYLVPEGVKSYVEKAGLYR
jgi:nicotinate-nucleotide adenylyltransferase